MASSICGALLCVCAMTAHAAPEPPATESAEVAVMASWIQRTGDHQGLAFIIVDKRSARLHVFDASGTRYASSPVLLGRARGDKVVPGSAEQPLASVTPSQRITPAGRFMSEPGRNLNNEDIVWVDYDAAISIHRVRSGKASERRLQRLATATADDNYITYGCINVPAAFYNSTIDPVFGRTRGVVYVLPEKQTTAAFFGVH